MRVDRYRKSKKISKINKKIGDVWKVKISDDKNYKNICKKAEKWVKINSFMV